MTGKAERVRDLLWGSFTCVGIPIYIFRASGGGNSGGMLGKGC